MAMLFFESNKLIEHFIPLLLRLDFPHESNSLQEGLSVLSNGINRMISPLRIDPLPGGLIFLAMERHDRVPMFPVKFHKFCIL
jgi:hypothetical protein